MLNIGLIGLGGIGTVHANSWAHVKGVKISAVCDPSPAGQEKAKAMGFPCYTGLTEMLRDFPVDVVDVCTPSFLHRDCVIEALESGRHVICEKPLALKSRDVRDMYALAEQKQVQLLVGHVVQFAPASIALHKLVESGEYGKPLEAAFLRLSACPKWAAGGWLFDKNKSGLLPFDLHIHDLDLLISLFGIPKDYDVASGGREGLAYKEYYRFLYKYPALNVTAEAAWYNADFPFTTGWRVYFENAVVAFDGTAMIAYSFDKPPRNFDITEKFKIETGINLPPTGMFYEELNFFAQRIQSAEREQYRKDEIIALIEILENITKE